MGMSLDSFRKCEDQSSYRTWARGYKKRWPHSSEETSEWNRMEVALPYSEDAFSGVWRTVLQFGRSGDRGEQVTIEMTLCYLLSELQGTRRLLNHLHGQVWWVSRWILKVPGTIKGFITSQLGSLLSTNTVSYVFCFSFSRLLVTYHIR